MRPIQDQSNQPFPLSPYAQTGTRLVENGYSAIPAHPGEKFPGVYGTRGWFPAPQWQRFCDRLPTEIELSFWEKWPDAGVCIALNHTLKVIDVDTDDPGLMAAELSVVPDSAV